MLAQSLEGSPRVWRIMFWKSEWKHDLLDRSYSRENLPHIFGLSWTNRHSAVA